MFTKIGAYTLFSLLLFVPLATTFAENDIISNQGDVDVSCNWLIQDNGFAICQPFIDNKKN